MIAARSGLAAAVLVLGGVVLARRLARGVPARYQPRLFLLTPAEADFYRVPRAALAGDWHAFAQVRVADLVSIDGRSPQARRLALNKVAAKSVDYVICDPQFRPRLVVELNDRGHDLASWRDRDLFVAGVCRAVTPPLVFAVNRRPFDAAAVRALLVDNGVAIRPLRSTIHARHSGPGLAQPWSGEGRRP